ncbi:MAG: FAD-linked oxidase C-terminal domain-containing protein [Chitinophagaceae bacterium]
MKELKIYFDALAEKVKGELYYDSSTAHQAQLIAYSTDASVYKEKPVAVCIPANATDLRVLVGFARIHGLTLIPRAAGTSLAGQVVGSGIIVDISRYFNRVLEINAKEKWVRVEPGVIRDDLNHYLRPFGLMFGPETSTASRAMIGGMIGNNSCGLHSMVWGAVRDHLQEVTVILSDGSQAIINEQGITSTEKSIASDISERLHTICGSAHNRELVHSKFPRAAIKRRNTGYALDALMEMAPFTTDGPVLNFAKLIAGSEGTLALITEAKLGLLPLPPKQSAVVCIHCHTLSEALQANIIALKHAPMASELVDKFIMDFTIDHPEYGRNRYFIEGDPAALLMVEFMDEDRERLNESTSNLIGELVTNGLGYAHPVLYDEQTKFAWDIRKAGLGLLRNQKGDAQPVNLIEDCAVLPQDLPAYAGEVQELLARHKVQASYYAHAGQGELHIEPMINLKSNEGVKTFRAILEETVQLVKKYGGSLSGEHGDGRLRGEFIPAIFGEEVYSLFKEVKDIFDSQGVFNAGKITDTPPMDVSLRREPDLVETPRKTIFDFSASDGMLRLAEKCSGSGDCRRSELSGGVMCPSYMATRREKDTTRARANLLRQFLSDPGDLNPLAHGEIYEVMDLCLSCKGCKTECPSGVDITKLKAEFLQHYYDKNGVPFRAKLIGNFSAQMSLASKFRPIYNFVFSTTGLRRLANKMVGFHPDRSIPLLPSTTLRAWISSRPKSNGGNPVYLFCDEFTNYLDVEIGKKAIHLLEALGYEVLIPEHLESGRTYLSKGLVRKAVVIANQNINSLTKSIPAGSCVVGIEPSAILTLRDEYPDLAYPVNKSKARRLAAQAFTIEEFLAKEFHAGNIPKHLFTTEPKNLVLHGHCYQKVLSFQEQIRTILSIPENYSVSIIPSGCCGMAGSFGYEKEHYDISMSVGELVLFPAIRKLPEATIVAASGTSCRHQIRDGTKKTALHPVEILWDALRSNQHSAADQKKKLL